MVCVEQINLEFKVDPSWHWINFANKPFILPSLWYKRSPEDQMLQSELLPDMVYDSLLWKCEQSYIDLKEKTVIAVYRRGKGHDKNMPLLRDVEHIHSIVVSREDLNQEFPKMIVFSGIKFEMPPDNLPSEMGSIQMQATRYVPVMPESKEE